MKTFTKTVAIFKSAAKGRGYIEITMLVCRAKNEKGISTARKYVRKSREGWEHIDVVGGDVGYSRVDRPWKVASY